MLFNFWRILLTGWLQSRGNDYSYIKPNKILQEIHYLLNIALYECKTDLFRESGANRKRNFTRTNMCQTILIELL